MFFQSSHSITTRKPLFLFALLLIAVLALSPLKAGAQSAEINSIVTIDADGDELSEEQELELGTDPTLYDSDGDALGDGAEWRQDGWGTNPLNPDTDDDGFWDGDELFTWGTDPKDPESYPAEQVQSTMQIELRGLPIGYTGNDFAGDSTPIEGVNISVLIYGNDMATTVTTDQAGIATFDHLAEATYQVLVNITEDDADFITVFGTPDGFEPRQHENQDTNQPIVYVGPQEQLNGTIYVIPVDFGPGEQVQGSFQIDVRSLPAGYDGSNWWNDSEAMAGITVTVAIPGTEYAISAETNESGVAVFETLVEGDYYVILGIPGHDAEFLTYFGAQGDTEQRAHDGEDTNQVLVHLNSTERLYGTFYVIPIDAGAEPTPTKSPAQVGGEDVTGLPDTGAGSESGSGFGTEAYIALTVLIALAMIGRVATRRRA
jgi:hypothetical protein